MQYLNLLKDLSMLEGISGFETKVKNYLIENLSKYNLNYKTDNLGSIVFNHNEAGIMLAAHMDEVGFMVKKITKEGFLKVQPIGGWWSQVVLSHEFYVIAEDGKKYLAISGSKPPHLLKAEELKKPFELENLYLDLGLSSKEEVLKLKISEGCPVCPKQEFAILNNTRNLLGKAWDNRIGCAVLSALISKRKNHNNINYCFTVQEEVGLRGAKTTTSIVNPKIAIAIDSGIANDFPGSDSEGFKLGAGPQVLFYDGGLLANKNLLNLIKKVAKENNIPIQLTYLERGSTDAAQMQFSKNGAATIALLVPARYIHSHRSVINYDDFENTVDLLDKLLDQLSDQKIFDSITKF